jgi:drug/metabolite transporter (DMT)-like permease
VIITALCVYQIVAAGGWPKSISATTWILIVLAGVLSALGNLAILRAQALSPNPGLVATVMGLQGGLVAILAVFLLRDKLNALQIAGIVLGIMAVGLIGWGSSNNQKSSLNSGSNPVAHTQKLADDL